MTDKLPVAFRNRWVVRRDAVAQWVVSFPAGLDLADAWRWFEQAVTVLDDAGVWRVNAAPTLGYRRAEHGALAAFLAANVPGHQGFSGFGFLDAEGRWLPMDIVSRLCWYDQDGSITTGDVRRMEELRRGLRPDIPMHERDPAAGGLPVSVFGRRRLTSASLERWGMRVEVELTTDIWLPWVRGYLTDRDTGEDIVDVWFDNRELASRNAPALTPR